MLLCVIEQASDAVQSTAAGRKDAVPSKVPRYEKSLSSSSYSISNETLTKHLTALWERDDSALPVTAAASTSRAGSKRKAASVSSYLSACKPDVSLPPSPVTSYQPNTSTILSQLLSSCCGSTSLPASILAINSTATSSPQLNPQRNILLLQNERQAVATAKQPSTVHASRRSATESISTDNSIFRLPSYEQVIGNRTPVSSPLVKTDNATNDVFVPSPQSGSLSFVRNTVPSLVADPQSSSVDANSLLLSQSAADSATIASHMQLDSAELLRQLEQILSEPSLSLADVDNMLSGCSAVPPSLPQSLSARDQKAISLIQSQLMSVEASASLPAVTSSPHYRNGTLCQLLSGNLPLTSETLLSTDKSEMRVCESLAVTSNQLLLSATSATVKSSQVAASQYQYVFLIG